MCASTMAPALCCETGIDSTLKPLASPWRLNASSMRLLPPRVRAGSLGMAGPVSPGLPIDLTFIMRGLPRSCNEQHLHGLFIRQHDCVVVEVSRPLTGCLDCFFDGSIEHEQVLFNDLAPPPLFHLFFSQKEFLDLLKCTHSRC